MIIAVKAFRRVLDSMVVPRAVLTPYPLGRPLGAPGEVGRQRAAILAALEQLERAEHPGTIVDLPTH